MSSLVYVPLPSKKNIIIYLALYLYRIGNSYKKMQETRDATYLPHRVGIMSLKSSPGGQSFSFNTIGFPSASCSRSAIKQRIISHFWHQSENDTAHQSLFTWFKERVVKKRSFGYSLEMTWKPSQKSRTFTSEMIAQFLQLTRSTSWSPNSLLKASGCHKWLLRRLSIPETNTGWTQSRGNKREVSAKKNSFHEQHSLMLHGSYLSLFPAFSEDLPVVAVAWIL